MHPVMDHSQPMEFQKQLALCYQIVQASPAFVVVIDTDGKTLMMNEAMLSRMGYTADEIIGRDYLTTFVPECDRLALTAIFQQIVVNHLPTLSENHIQTRDGRLLLVEWHGRPVFRDDGRLDYFFGVGIDITQQRNATDALSASESRHRTILDYMQEAVIYADDSNLIRHINAFACRLLGTTHDATVGHPITEFHTDELNQQIENIIRTFRDNPQQNVISSRRSFRSRELNFRFSPVRDADGHYRGIIANIIDFTELATIQRQLAEARRMETVGTLAGGIAHDFNNLMTTVLGLASHMRSRKPPSDPDHERLSQIENAAATAGQLAHQLLVFARGGRFKPSRVACADVLQRAFKVLMPSIPGTVRFASSISPELDEIVCDSTQIEQVILNLCRNAIDAMPQGGELMIQAKNVELQTTPANASPPIPPGSYVRIAVTDTGCGIDAETAERVYDPFFSTKPAGYGLGLASAYGIIKAHNGAIGLTSEVGKGSTFHLWLPRPNA